MGGERWEWEGGREGRDVREVNEEKENGEK